MSSIRIEDGEGAACSRGCSSPLQRELLDNHWVVRLDDCLFMARANAYSANAVSKSRALPSPGIWLEVEVSEGALQQPYARERALVFRQLFRSGALKLGSWLLVQYVEYSY